MRLMFIIIALLLALFIFGDPTSFIGVAILREAAGWYRIEDHMCTIPGEDCHAPVFRKHPVTLR